GDGEGRLMQPEIEGMSESRHIGRRALQLASLCYFWLLVGFTLGTIVLLWPVRWLTSTVHRMGGSQRLENWLVILLVLAYVAVSFILARRLHGPCASAERRRVRWSVTGAPTLIAALTAWSRHDPGRMLSAFAGGGEVEAVKHRNGAA